MTMTETLKPNKANPGNLVVRVSEHCGVPTVTCKGLAISGLVYSKRARDLVENLKENPEAKVVPYIMPNHRDLCRIIELIEAGPDVRSLEISGDTATIGLRTASADGWLEASAEIVHDLATLEAETPDKSLMLD